MEWSRLCKEKNGDDDIKEKSKSCMSCICLFVCVSVCAYVYGCIHACKYVYVWARMDVVCVT